MSNTEIQQCFLSFLFFSLLKIRASQITKVYKVFTHLEFRRVPVYGSNNSGADHKALFTGHGAVTPACLCSLDETRSLPDPSWPTYLPRSLLDLTMLYEGCARGGGVGCGGAELDERERK